MAVANVATWAGRSIINRMLLTGNTGTFTTPNNISWGLGVSGLASTQITGSAFSDVNLFQPASPSPEARVAGTATVLTANQLTDVFQVVGTITALSAKSICEVGLFDTATSLSGMSPIATTALTSSATSVTIGAFTTGFQALPTAGNFYAQIELEVVVVTGGQGTSTLTITRGALGSTSTSHAVGAFVIAGGDGGAHTSNSSASLETWVPSGANGGSLFAHADFAVINLNTNDSIQFTLKTQLA